MFLRLRQEFPIHKIETDLNVKAEVILDAISQASDLTLRGIRGIIAESSFFYNVVRNLDGWEFVPPSGNQPYDCTIRDTTGPVRIQVKMQRLKAHKPMMASEAARRFRTDMYAVETQRTRSGKGARGEDTRPYRFDEFDILAVSFQPSTGAWDRFLYTVARWLLPQAGHADLMNKFQPVPVRPNDDWTDDLLEAVRWFRSDLNKTIGGLA